MNVIDRIKSLVTKQPRFDYNLNRYFGVGGLVPPDRNPEGYLRAYSEVGWLHAVVFRIALGCSEVQWNLHDVSNRDKPKQIFEHPLLKLLHLVNPFQTSNEFIALDTIYQELVGESFWILNFNGRGEPAEIWIPYPHKMSIVPDKEKFIKGYIYGEGENAVPFNVNEVIHFKYPSPLNQYRGLAPTQSIGVDLDAEMYSSQWNRSYFHNSARPDGVISFDYNLSDEQFDKLKKQWSEKYKGVSKAHQVALLEGGGKYLQIQNTVKDMDFSNLKLRNRDVILGVFGMPQSVMGISENVNKANAEAGDYTFARWIVKPRLDWKTAKLQEQLIPKFRDSKNLKLGFEEVVKETVEQKITSAESGMRAGYLTINEARSMQGYDPLPNGDVLLVPLNLIPTPISGIMQPPPAPAREVEESYKGGEGSGNFDHEGRPGEVGGSGGGGGMAESDETKFNNAQLAQVYPENHERYFLKKEEKTELKNATDELGQTSNSTTAPTTYRENPTLMDEYVSATGYGTNPDKNPERANELKPKIEELRQRKMELETKRDEGVGEFKKAVAAKLEGKPEVYVRFGDVPESGKSYNFRDSQFENGVSVYEAIKVDKGLYYIKSQDFLFTGPSLIDRPLYEIKGKLIGHGSDGEPLLNVTGKTKPKISTIFHPVIGLADTGGKNAYRESLKKNFYPIENMKGLTPDQKKTHWERYAQKTERQETMFKRVFESVFDEQKKQIVEQYTRTGSLPNDLIDENTAKKFEPALGLIYEDAFSEAV